MDHKFKVVSSDATPHIRKIENKVFVPQKSKEAAKRELEKERLRDRQMVRGIFKFYEVAGATLKFPFKKYKEDPLETYTLTDGQIYTIPRGVARHLNNNGWYPVHRYELEEGGKASQRIGQKVRRFGFQSLDFVDDMDLVEPVDLVTVEKVPTNLVV